MATTVALVGGPCDGQTRRISDATLASGHLTCDGSTYTRLRQVQTNGLITFGSSDPTPSPGGGDTIFTPHVHKGWNDIRKSVNHNLPAALRHSNRQMVAALHSLARARNVRL